MYDNRDQMNSDKEREVYMRHCMSPLDFTVEEPDDLSHPDAGLIADALKNDPSFYGKHVSLFIK